MNAGKRKRLANRGDGDGRWRGEEDGSRSKKKKKKKKLRRSSAGSITTAAGGDDLLKATRSQPLGPKRRTTLLIFRCSLFSLSTPCCSFRALSLLLSFFLSSVSLLLSVSFRASAFLRLAELCTISLSFFCSLFFLFCLSLNLLIRKIIDYCEKYYRMYRIFQSSHSRFQFEIFQQT